MKCFSQKARPSFKSEKGLSSHPNQFHCHNFKLPNFKQFKNIYKKKKKSFGDLLTYLQWHTRRLKVHLLPNSFFFFPKYKSNMKYFTYLVRFRNSISG